jgi:3,4-dihydroxy 2-butanone 4-phosphate synthase/GTP cyclohydrolase II
VLVRTGQTEGSVDLARLAGLEPAGVLCEVMSADGTMARRPELLRFARRHKLVMLSVADVIRYRLESEQLVRRVEEARSPWSAWEISRRFVSVDRRSSRARGLRARPSGR